MKDLAHEIWAMAQLAPHEGIEDGVERIEKVLRESIPGKMKECLEWWWFFMDCNEAMGLYFDGKMQGSVFDELEGMENCAHETFDRLSEEIRQEMGVE